MSINTLMPLPWQAKQWQLLETSWQAQKMPHALLLTGPAGCGKMHFATAWLARILCVTNQFYACGHCQTCQLNATKTYPDVYYLVPEEEGKQIKIDAVRALQADLSAKPFFNGWRVVLIAPVTAMNIAAANALLKLLEEPGNNILFLLLTDNATALLPTLRSRCQTISLPTPIPTVAKQWLAEQGVSDVAHLLQLTHGAPLKALDYANDAKTPHHYCLFIANQLALAAQKKIDSNELLQTVSEKVNLPLLLDILGDWTACVAEYYLLTAALRQQALTGHWLQALCALTHTSLNLNELFSFWDQVNNARAILQRQKISLNTQLTAEQLLLAWLALLN